MLLCRDAASPSLARPSPAFKTQLRAAIGSLSDLDVKDHTNGALRFLGSFSRTVRPSLRRMSRLC